MSAIVSTERKAIDELFVLTNAQRQQIAAMNEEARILRARCTNNRQRSEEMRDTLIEATIRARGITTPVLAALLSVFRRARSGDM